MIALSLAEVAAAVGGHLIVGAQATEATIVSGTVTTDSREVVAGGVFVAKRGESDDGHRFVASAVQAGASLVIGERDSGVSVPQIIVADSVAALGALATDVVRRVRERGALRVIGITGSNGKTTTKNLVRTILERQAPTVAARKSFNNEVGAPTTMLELTYDTQYLVAEMGASAVGEISSLVRMACPDIGVVLKVGLAHAGEFGGIEQTIRAKSEMVTDLAGSAVAVLNVDDPNVAAMAELTRARVVRFGLSPEADVWASDIEVGRRGTTFTLHSAGERASVVFGVLGEHHVMNALAAAAVARECGVPLAEIASALESVTLAERWRMQLLPVRDDITLINDAYNASPDSMSAALKTLAQVRGEGRSIAVLGEMTELGELAGDEHDRIGLQVVRLGISQLVVVGAGARRMHITAINEGSWDGESVYFEHQADALAYLERTTRPGDTILVKSSNSAGLRVLGDQLGELLS
ncbi:MAG TPA: UDP-N-acetylmuramoyl-tripeptide--D-alanyl-D-alanine ligase [Candidatus Lumbricidophila sp.]|nr:UDP-N-acetylmuramoyl-tripeptide--D-alanyl-D-alanine ligase [Candidatus Lumbricidophila sp.]